MINSLIKDSHMGPRFCPQNSYSGRSAYKPQDNIVTKDKSNHSTSVTIRKPAEPNFCGFSSSRLANADIFVDLIKTARTFLNYTSKHKQVIDLLDESVKTLMDSSHHPDENVTRFLDLHKDSVQAVIKTTKDILNDEHKKDPLDAKNLVRKTKNAINTAVRVYPTVEKPSWIYTNNYIKKLFIMADNSQSVFGALFALVLTGIFRPATIIALPGQKKNKDDKKYAAAHSVASGIIGYIIALAISSPIAKAMKKLEDEPEKFLKKDTLKYLRKKGAVNTAKKYVNILHEAILAFPRAAITIALIPPILKHVFGYELKKDKPVADNTKTSQGINGGSK